MLVDLWNLCKFVLLKIIALSWNVVIKLVQGEQPQNTTAKGKVSMAVEVWTDVLGFVRRVDLARISLTNWQIHQICWPRLHGNRVMAHVVEEMIVASRGWPSAILQIRKQRKCRKRIREVPFANCPPPEYITGFSRIRINFLDNQVLAFIKLIAPHLNGIDIEFLTIHMENLDKQQRGFMNQLLKIFQEETSPNTLISMYTRLANIPFLPDPDMDSKMRQIDLDVDADTDIPLLIKLLATPRPDGQQRMIWLFFSDQEDDDKNDQLAREMLDAIKQDFRTSTQPLPQPFYIECFCHYPFPLHNLNIPGSEEENAQTDETLIIEPMHFEEDGWSITIYRHPKGEHEKWAEDARMKLQGNNGLKTYIQINDL